MNCHLFDKRNPKDVFNIRHGIEGCYDYDDHYQTLWEEWKACIEFNRVHIDDLFRSLTQKDEVISRYWKMIEAHRYNDTNNDIMVEQIVNHCAHLIELAKMIKN
jgi:hypothetical protein